MADYNRPDTIGLIKVYFEYQLTHDPALAWAWDAVDADGWDDPEGKWDLILQLVEAAPTPFQLGLVGAGILETLLNRHGDRFVDRVAQEAQTNARLRQALAHVWFDENNQGTIDRLLSLTSDVDDGPRETS